MENGKRAARTQENELLGAEEVAGLVGVKETTETKSSYKTTELIVYVLAVLGVLIASFLVQDASFGADHAWRYVTYLTVGYMISRGLAKAGSREPQDG